MGRVIRPSEVATQVQTMKAALDANIERLYGVLAAIRSFVDESDLEGAAWSGMKDQMAAHETVITGMIYAMEALSEAGDNLINLCGSEYLSEDVLLSQLETLRYNKRSYQDTIDDYQSRLQNPLYYQIYSQTAYNMIQYYQQHLDNNNELITFANGKLDTIDQIDHAISNLNTGVESMLAQVKQGLQYLGGSWNGTGFSPAAGRNLSWMTEINKVKSEKLEQIAERALISKLLDPYSSVLLDSKDRERTLEFLRKEMEARGGSIELNELNVEDWKDVAIYSAIIKLTAHHGLAFDARDMLYFLEDMLTENNIDGVKQPLHFDKDMLRVVEKVSAQKFADIQKGGFDHWTEKHILWGAISAEIVTGVSYDVLLSQYMSDEGQDIFDATNGILEEQAEGTGGANTLTDAQSSRLKSLDNTIKDHLTDGDFSGTLRDLQGNPVPNGKGGFFDHLGEMKDSYKSLQKTSRGLEGSLKNPNLSDVDRALLQKGLDDAKSYMSKIEKMFEPYGGLK